MKTNLITPPSIEPVALADAKLQCEVDADITVHDALIAALISAAREHAEHITGRAFISQVHEVALDGFTGERIALPISPVMSIDSVKYIDASGSRVQLSDSVYGLDSFGIEHALCLKPGQAWPSVGQGINPIVIRFTAGYGSTAATVPNVVKQWILVRIAAAYKNPEGYAENGFAEMPFIDRLLDPVRVPRF